MPRNTKTELTSEAVIAAIEKEKPSSIAKLAQALKYRGSVSSWLKGKLMELVPDLSDRLRVNASMGDSVGKIATPSEKKLSKKVSMKYPRSEVNPFRDSSAYATAFDVLFAHRAQGIERSKLVAEVARICRKPQARAYYDCVVVCSATEAGKAHKSCSVAADSFYVLKGEGGNLRLVLRDRKF